MSAHQWTRKANHPGFVCSQCGKCVPDSAATKPRPGGAVDGYCCRRCEKVIKSRWTLRGGAAIVSWAGHEAEGRDFKTEYRGNVIH